MSFEKPVIQYHYYPTTFYKNQYQNTGDFIKIPYTSKSNSPNIILNGNEYTTTTLYIVKKIHDFADYDAELVIEHQPLTNYAPPLYVCFLLKSGGAHSSIDDILSAKQDTELDIDSLGHMQKAVVNDTVIVFPTPIAINSSLDHITSVPFDISPHSENYIAAQVSPIQEGFQEGVANPATDQLAGYCYPISETDAAISDNASWILPEDSPIIKNNSQYTAIQTMLNFAGFFVLIIATVFITPTAYRLLLVDLVLDNKPQFSPQQLLNRLYAIDIFTALLFFGFSVSFINYGIVNNMSSASIFGFYVFIFFMASLIILQYKRIFNPAEFLEPLSDSRSGTVPDMDAIQIDGGFIFDNLHALFLERVAPVPPATTPTYKFHIGILGVLFIFLALFFFMKAVGLGKGGFMSNMLNLYALLIAMYIMTLINHFRKKE
jgi:hypothetical protein